MRRQLKTLWAEVRCEWYLWRKGMWQGERRFTAWDHENKIICIAAVKGSLFDMPNMVFVRIFWDERVAGSAEKSGQSQR